MHLSVVLLGMLLACCSARNGAVGTKAASARGGREISRLGCGSCHTIPGIIGAHGKVGPSLEGFAGHSYVAGDLPNQPLNLEPWIQHPHAVHPDTVMPELGVTDAEARDIASFLYSLKQEPK
jgi:cytochrome c